MTTFHYFSLADADQARGAVIVIDVLRAFTTAAYAFDSGVEKIYPVSGIEEAVRLKNDIKGAYVMGEDGGYKPEVFDFSNSPGEIYKAAVSGHVLVQRTSAGTQGLTRVVQSEMMLAASFVVAGATARYLYSRRPDQVSFVLTGIYKGRDGDEDRSCAEYIEALMKGEYPDFKPYLKRVETSTVGSEFSNGKLGYLMQEDFDLSIQVDRFNFAMPVHWEHGCLVIKKYLYTSEKLKILK
jgi:2-phosphosulfolactate phosphatase